MRDLIAAKLRELLCKLDEYEQERFSDEECVFKTFLLKDDHETVTPDDAAVIAGFIRCAAKGLNDAELDRLCDSVNSRAERIQRLEDDRNQTWEAERLQEYWDSKEFFSASDIGIYFNISHSGAKVNNLLESLGLQERRGGGWVATAKSEGIALQRGLEEGQKPYIRWERSIIPYLTKALQ